MSLQPLPLLSSSRRDTPRPSPLGHVDEEAPGQRDLHRQPGALGPHRVLDRLDEDLLAWLDEVLDLLPLALSVVSSGTTISST